MPSYRGLYYLYVYPCPSFYHVLIVIGFRDKQFPSLCSVWSFGVVIQRFFLEIPVTSLLELALLRISGKPTNSKGDMRFLRAMIARAGWALSMDLPAGVTCDTQLYEVQTCLGSVSLVGFRQPP